MKIPKALKTSKRDGEWLIIHEHISAPVSYKV